MFTLLRTLALEHSTTVVRNAIQRKPLAYLAQRVAIRLQAADRGELRNERGSVSCRSFATFVVVYFHNLVPRCRESFRMS
jgi:hypothetical protein